MQLEKLIERINILEEKVRKLAEHTNCNFEQKEIVIYTDGSCLTNPGRGGWAAIFEDKEISGGEEYTINNRMELIAVIHALKATKPKSKIKLFTDSQYVKNGITSWIKNWKKSWKTSSKKPVLNKDLWVELDELNFQRDVTFEWVKGHAGNELNERCNQLAKARAMLGRVGKV